jgi:hypothetical protein
VALLFSAPQQITYFWPILFLACNLFANHLNTTIKAQLSCSYKLDAFVWMPPSQCHIAASKEMVHKSILYALTFFSKAGKKK